MNQTPKLRIVLQKTFPGILLFIFALVFLHKLATLEFVTIGHVEDHLRQFYPYRTHDAEMLKSLTIPLWNPYTFGGFPYLASMRCHIFYPLNLIYLILPTYLGMNVNYILQIFLAGLFTYGLGKTLRINRYSALVSAVSFMFCGFLIDKVSWGHLTMLGSAFWLPLILLLFIKAVENKKMVYGVLAGIIFAVQLSTGHPQLPYYGILTLFFFTLYSFLRIMLKEKSFKTAIIPVVYFLILVLVGIGLMSIQLIPAAELTSHSLRSVFDDRFAFYTRWSMEPSYIVTFMLPRLSPIIGTNSFPFPVSLGYLGILPLLLAVISLSRIRENKYVAFFWFVTLLALILALGRYTPVYSLFYRVFPGFASFRNPIFFLYLYVFSMSVLAGFGMDYIQSINWTILSRKLKTIIGVILVICFLFFLIAAMTYFLSSFKSNLGFLNSLWVKVQKFHMTLIYDFSTIAFILGTSTIILILWNKHGKEKNILYLVIISLIFFELFLYGRNFIRVYDLAPFVSKRKWVDYLKQDEQLYRVLPILPYPEQDPVLKLNKISSINGYGSLEILQHYIDFIGAFQKQPVHQDACLTRVKNYNSQAVNLLNTKYILTVEAIENDEFQLVYTDFIPMAKTWDPYNNSLEKIYVYKNNNALPRAFFVDSMKIIPNSEDVLRVLKEPGFDPLQTVILEKKPGLTCAAQIPFAEEEKIEFVSYKENEFTLRATSSKNCFLFLSEVYYPGWKVFVDDEQQEIYKANYLFRAIYLPKGSHKIKFIFDPYTFKIGKMITLITSLILIIYCCVQKNLPKLNVGM